MRAIGRALLRFPTTPGLVVAAVFWWFSLVPSLMPRAAVIQGAVGAICAGIGYMLGLLGAWIVRRVSRGRASWSLRDRLPERVPLWWIGGGAGALLVVAGSVMWVRWQNLQRPLVAMESMSAVSIVPMLLVTIVVGFVLAMIGRLVGGAVRRLNRWNRRHLAGWLAMPTTILLVVLVAGFLVRDVAASWFVSWADRTFSLVDGGTHEGTVRPTAPEASGSPDSLVEWDDLGLQGRQFVAHATSADDLRAFAATVGDDASAVVAPVRAYAGMKSADDVGERAELAVADLERAGGFDREVLVVATSTGTGWIDPDASRALELMYGGDTAIVSMQYSFLPSWISFVTDLDRATEAGAELFEAVHDRWSQLPEDDRPRLIVFGLSLGSYGANGAFVGPVADTTIGNIVARSDGALFVGTPYATETLRQVVDDRDDGSPAWAPVFDGGQTVRFDTRDPNQPHVDGSWDEPRVLFFQHPSDPVVHWYYNWFWSSPEWMDSPRGYDVPSSSWFPIVTGVQGVFDLMAGFAAPPGFGHDYRLDYPSAWADVVPRDGWTDADTTALEAFTQTERDAGLDAG